MRHAAEVALETAQRLAEEGQRKIREVTEETEQVAKNIADSVTNTSRNIEHNLEKLTPSFDEKLQQIMDEVSEVAAAAAGEGVDITEAVNAAVDVAFRKVEETLKAAIDAVNRFFHEA